MRGSADEKLRFADDGDLLFYESKLDLGGGNGIWPRVDKSGNQIRSWERYHQLGMNELAGKLRARKATTEPFELGRLSMRSKDRLRKVAAAFALHYLFWDANRAGDPWFSDQAHHYWDRAIGWLDEESVMLDYDSDNSGTIDETDKNQPFPQAFVRG